MKKQIAIIAGTAACVLCASVGEINAQQPQTKDSTKAAQAAQTQARQAAQGAAAAPAGRRGGPLRAPLTFTPRFKVEAYAVKALDESGPDWAGSDEVYAIVQSAGVTMKTETLEDIDTGEQHEFTAATDCMVPIQSPAAFTFVCDPQGVDGPLNFTVHLYESDFDWGTVIGHFHPWSTEPGQYDDLIGREEVTWTDAQLIALMPKVGDTSFQWMRLGGPCGYIPPGGQVSCSPYSPSATGPDYLFIYQITRLPDHVTLTPPQP